MSIERLRSHWGFTRTPFTKDLAPSMIHRHPGHAEAVARIAWCVDEAAIGAVTGEVGSGKTVAVRAALAELDRSRHTVIYLGNPAIGARGLYTSHRHPPRRDPPLPPLRPHPPSRRRPRRRSRRARQTSGASSSTKPTC